MMTGSNGDSNVVAVMTVVTTVTGVGCQNSFEEGANVFLSSIETKVALWKEFSREGS
jgi:hypothetical protein